MSVTVTLANYPNTLAPINAPLWFNFTSASYTLTDFRYRFEVFGKVEPFSTTSYTKIGQYDIPPRPTYNGLITPNRILKSLLSYNIYPFITGWTHSSTNLIDYIIKYGTEYNPGITFSSTYNSSGSLALTFSVAHNLSAGDIITIDKDNKAYNPTYDGTCSVVSLPTTTSIVTDKSYTATILSSESGVVNNVSNWLGTSSALYTWNGTRQYDERTTDFTNTYTLTNSSSLFLTDTGLNKKKVQTNDYETLNCILPTTSLTFSYIVSTYNDTSLLNTYTYSLISPPYRFQTIGVGPMNLTGVSFTNVSYYTVQAFSNGVTASMPATYSIDTDCSLYDKTRVCFMNNVGGYDYFNFTKDNKETLDIERTEYEKVLDWNYNIGDRGRTILNKKVKEKHIVNSDWITEAEAKWLRQLKYSDDVYIINGTNKYPIIITDTSYEVKTYLRNQLFNITLEYEYAYKINVQNE